MKTYQLTVNEEQLKVIAKYLEIGCRLKCGQLDTFADLFHDKVFDREELDYCMEQAKILLFPELQKNEFLGIFRNETPKSAKQVYDIYKTILHEFNKNSELCNVHKEPHTLLAGEFVTKIEEVE